MLLTEAKDNQLRESNNQKVHPQPMEEAMNQKPEAMEALISKLFVNISSLKSAYIQLQGAHTPYDPDKIQAADKLVISELKKLSELKHFYRENNPKPVCVSPQDSRLAAEIQEQQSLLKTYEVMVKKFQSEIQNKDSEILQLQQQIEEANQKKVKLEKNLKLRGLSMKESEGSADENGNFPVDLTPDLFTSVVEGAFKAIHDFSKPLINMMKAAGWDLDAAANSVEPNVVYAKRAHKKYAFESHICQRMFCGFQHETFSIKVDDLALTKEDFFRQFISLKDMDPLDMLGQNPDSIFGKFCRSKYLLVVHPKMEASFFGNLDQRNHVAGGGHPRTPFYQVFLKLAKAIWLLHRLAYSFDPSVKVFQVKRGNEFSDVYMDSVVKNLIIDENDPKPKVGLMVSGRFHQHHSHFKLPILTILKQITPNSSLTHPCFHLTHHTSSPYFQPSKMDGKKLSWTVADAVDYKGFPADKSKTGGWIPAALILGIEICERLSTMGIAVNLVTYLGGVMHLPSAASANIVTDFMGTCFLLCLLGGFLADSFLGRYYTILISAIIQTLGTATLAVSTKLPQLRPPPCDGTKTCKEANGFQMGILYLALYLIALGTGGLKSSISGFGTDQFDDTDEKEKAKMAYFFNRFFFFISTGTLMAVTVLVYIQDEVGRSWAYGICSVSMLIAILLFVSGTKRYRYKKSMGSPVVQILQVIAAAIKKRKLELPQNVGLLYEDSSDHASRIEHTKQFQFLDKAAIVAEGDFQAHGAVSALNPWKLSSVTKVEEVKMMARLLPIWATTIIFWTTYAQMITFSVQQASTMERSIGSFQIPAGSLTVFFVAAILITLGVYDRLIMPLWKKWKGKQGFTNIQRMAIGLVLSILGMAAAALAERKRLAVAKAVGGDTTTLPISVFLLIPQFFLVGAGEAFIYTGQLDFFITKSPKGMKTMSTGLFLTTLSLGFFISSFLVSVVKRVTGNDGEGWLADNINYGRLDCFYGLLTILSIINFVAFLVCVIWYMPQKRKDFQKNGIVNGNLAEEKC